MLAGKLRVTLALTGLCLAFVAPADAAAPLELNAVQFPEKRPVSLTLAPTPIAPTAGVDVEVNYREGQARIQMSYEQMKPAILFGGDVTCFVVWAVTRDGQAENLGEMLTSKSKGKLSFSTGKKAFALMVTAESFYLVAEPSDLVVFTNRPATAGESTPFSFNALAEPPRHNMDGIAHLKWDSKVPIELLQARKALELATRHEAAVHSAEIHAEAEAAVASANEIATSSPKSRELIDIARRAVALSNEAFNISRHRIEAIEVERQLAQRREETAALEARAAEAEAAALAAEKLATEVRAEAELVRAEKERTVAETDVLRIEKASLQSTMLELRQDKQMLETQSVQLRMEKSAMELESQRLLADKSQLETAANRLLEDKTQLEGEATRLRDEKAKIEQFAAQLQVEKDELTGRLGSALSHVAETQQSGRGLVLSLPDILFDLNEAELKPETQVLLAKLSGILLIMPEQDVQIEGHTDSTGEADYNLALSEQRARAVREFIQTQGLNNERLRSIGYGVTKPVADNATSEGRRSNRRVEIVISNPNDAVAAR